MKELARVLVVLAVAGHLGLSMGDAFAGSPGTAGAAGGAAGAAGGTSGGAAGSGAGGAGVGSLNLAQSTNGEGQGPAPSKGRDAGGPAQIFKAPGEDDGACGGGLQLSDPNASTSALEGLAKISRETEHYLQRCGCKTQACVADALDTYAAGLQKIAPRLPRAFRKLPQIVAAAAHRARVAPTLKAAVNVLRAAVAIVHKTIELARPADPDEAAAATRGAELVNHTLNTAATTLERAETL